MHQCVDIQVLIHDSSIEYSVATQTPVSYLQDYPETSPSPTRSFPGHVLSSPGHLVTKAK